MQHKWTNTLSHSHTRTVDDDVEEEELREWKRHHNSTFDVGKSVGQTFGELELN